MSESAESLRSLVTAAAARPEVVLAVRQLYDDVQAEIQKRQPICQISGRCCKFEEYGHRLFVTTLELAAFMASGGGDAPQSTHADGKGCRFQVGKLCGVHTIRPFGCRMFFCDTTATEWQQATYERFHGRIKALHEELGVPYRYVEWRAALNEVISRPVANPHLGLTP